MKKPRAHKNYDYDYARLSWGKGFVIAANVYMVGTSAIGKFIYGSRREYKDHGKVFKYSNIEHIEKISKEEVVDKYFMGLL